MRPALSRVTFYSVGVIISFLTFLKEQIMNFNLGIGLWGLFSAIAAPGPKIGQKGTLIFGQILDP